MAALCDLLFEGLRESRGGVGAEKTARHSERPRFDLVERAHKFRQKRADETTTERIARGDREIEERSATCSRRARAPKAAAFDDLPSQERGNAHRQIANPRD